MNFSRTLLALSILFLSLVGCNDIFSESPAMGNPTPKDFLKNDSADIFFLEGIVYSNVQDVEWVDELEYKLGGPTGKITKQTGKASRFNNGTANKLPVGTKIYETNTQVTIATVNGKQIPYLKMVEG